MPGAINIGLNDSTAVWVGSLLDAKHPMVLVADEGKEAEAVLPCAGRLWNVKGYLKGSINAWKSAGRSVDTVRRWRRRSSIASIPKTNASDVRNEPEWTGGVIEGALVPLMELPGRDGPPEGPHLLRTLRGRLSFHDRLLADEAQRFPNVISITGGMNQVKQSHFHLVVPPTVTA